MAVPHSQQSTTACNCVSTADWTQLPATRDVVIVADDAFHTILFNVQCRDAVKQILQIKVSSAPRQRRAEQ